ncbi:MAG: hypothetical protein AB8B72_11835 [Crocinitomicaceae bacterium]
MKRIVVFTILTSLIGLSFSNQIKGDSCIVKPFKVYRDDKDTWSNIRNQPNGEIVLKLNTDYSDGYILTVIDFEDGCLNINHIAGIDEYEVSNFEGWVHWSIVGAATTYNLDLLDKPNGKTIIGKLIGEKDTFKIINAKCEWIEVNCNGVKGWVESDKICGNPVTTCP